MMRPLLIADYPDQFLKSPGAANLSIMLAAGAIRCVPVLGGRGRKVLLERTIEILGGSLC